MERVVLQSPVSSTQASPKVEASNRPKQAQHLPPCRQVQNGNTRVHLDLSDSKGMGFVDRLIRRLPSHPHTPKLKEVPKILPKIRGIPIHLPSLRASHGPTGIYSDCKRSEADGPDKGNQTSPVPGRLVYQGPFSGRSTSEHSDSGRSDPVLRVDNKSGEIQTKLTQVFSFVGYKYHLDSALVKPTQERWLKLQDLILRLKSKQFLTARCLMLLIGLLASTHRCLELKAVSLALQRFKYQCQNQSVGCYGQLNSSSLHKQTRMSPLSRDVCSPVEDHELVPSLPDNLKARHIPGCLNVMADILSRSNQIHSRE